VAVADEQIRIDVVAEDDASKVLDKVADEAEKLERLSPEIPVTADTDAADRALADVADEAKRLERLSPEIPVTADTSSADSALADVKSEAAALSRQDTEIVLRARIDDAKGALKALRDDLDQTADRADDTAKRLDRIDGGGEGISSRGNAIADLTGPLGEASSAASDFAGVFEGLGDIAGDVVGKLGGSAAQVAKVGQAMGVLGLAVTAGVTAWTLYQGSQKKAREETERMTAAARKLNDALEAGDAGAWAEGFAAEFPKALKAAESLGIGVGNMADYVQGATDVIPNLAERVKLLERAFVDAGLSEADAAEKTRQVVAEIDKAREAYATGRSEVGQYDRQQAELAEHAPLYVRRTEAVTAATDEATEATERGAKTMERAARAHEIAQGKIDATGAAYDRLRGKLDIEDAYGRFNEAWLLAVDAVRRGSDDAAAKVNSVKDAYLTLSETVGANPAEVAVTIDTISQQDLLHVKSSAERYFVQNPIMATVRASGATVSGGGSGSIRPTSVEPAPVVVNMSVPRGYRGDLLSDARRASRRTGRYYQRGVG
jgi:hypothetical protein